MGRRPERFAGRVDAGRELAGLLSDYAGREDVVVLGLPRGGVPVAAEVARALNATLDVLVVRKLGVPYRPELAMGAIADVGDAVEVVRNDTVLRHLRIAAEDFDAVYERESVELRRRVAAYRGDREPASITGRVVIIVDDGLATGSTMRAAVAAVYRREPAAVIVAVPVGAADTCRELDRTVDRVVCARLPEPFLAVRQGYDDFTQTPDEEVLRIMQVPRAHHPVSHRQRPLPPGPTIADPARPAALTRYGWSPHRWSPRIAARASGLSSPACLAEPVKVFRRARQLVPFAAVSASCMIFLACRLMAANHLSRNSAASSLVCVVHVTAGTR